MYWPMSVPCCLQYLISSPRLFGWRMNDFGLWIDNQRGVVSLQLGHYHSQTYCAGSDIYIASSEHEGIVDLVVCQSIMYPFQPGERLSEYHLYPLDEVQPIGPSIYKLIFSVPIFESCLIPQYDPRRNQSAF